MSLSGHLNRGGYGVALVGFLGGLYLLREYLVAPGSSPLVHAGKILRSRWWLPRLWLLLTGLVLLGGLSYHTTNYDFLSYRFPRVLHWCWEQRWYWIATPTDRENFSGVASEWCMTPLFVFFQTDRLFFLINFISYLFLPGLVFSFLIRLGVSGRVSWWWMWVLSSGYCYVLQAASAGNDSYAAVYLLAAFHYGFRARKTASARNFFLSCLAIALVTGNKASNVPLVLPWAIALLFHWRQVVPFAKPGKLILTCLVAAMISFLPTALLNLHFCGNAFGDPDNQHKVRISNPLIGLAGNSIHLAVYNLVPPLWYKTMSWDGIIPHAIITRVQQGFPRLSPVAGEMQIEEGAGVGLGVVLAVLFMLGLRLWPRSVSLRRKNRVTVETWGMVLGSLIAVLAYMTKMGSESTSRLLAPYYPLAIAAILVMVALDGVFIRRRVCQTVGGLVMLSAVPLVILNPARPLFPTSLVRDCLSRAGTNPALVARYDQVYTVYATRFDGLKEIRVAVPESETAVGLLTTGDDPTVSLWLPFGSREVCEVSPDNTRNDLDTHHIRFVAVDDACLENYYHQPLADLLRKWSAVVVLQKSLTVKAQRGAENWYLLRCTSP